MMKSIFAALYSIIFTMFISLICRMLIYFRFYHFNVQCQHKITAQMFFLFICSIQKYLQISKKITCLLSHNIFDLLLILPITLAASFTEGGASNSLLVVNETKLNPKESPGGGLAVATTTTTQSTLGPPSLSVGNHLDIPTSNPNLLSPDVLNQRRGSLSAPRNAQFPTAIN